MKGSECQKGQSYPCWEEVGSGQGTGEGEWDATEHPGPVDLPLTRQEGTKDPSPRTQPEKGWGGTGTLTMATHWATGLGVQQSIPSSD